MRETLARIISLQAEYAWQNTPAMEERGLLIRNTLRDELRAFVRAEFPEMDSEGGDGTGRKARVPWTRVFDPRHSTAPTDGWYAVYLVHGDGSGVTLSLNQATTRPEGDSFPRLPEQLLRDRVGWARVQLEVPLPAGELVGTIELAGGNLGEGYEIGHVLGFRYERDLPDEDRLKADLRIVLGLLRKLYAEGTAPTRTVAPRPESGPPRAELVQPTGDATNPRAPRQSSPAKRAAIEQHAMFMARDLLIEDGWAVDDTHLTRPYDFIARRGDQTLYVEVKGTTTTGETVSLTRNEVIHHQENPGQSCLIVVREIILLEDVDEPTCTGGIREMWLPWTIDQAHLTPSMYDYRVRPPAPMLMRPSPEGVRTRVAEVIEPVETEERTHA